MAAMARPVVGPAPFGSRLAAWSRARGLSQLALAAAADTTARHVSFLETGRCLVGDNLVRRHAAANDAIANRPQVARAALARLRRQLREGPQDDELRALVDVVRTAVADLPPGPAAGDELVICPQFRVGDRVIRRSPSRPASNTPST
jgi:transcriptional regulator with XRE-family HTH domain